MRNNQCKKCRKPTPTQNIFNGECVDCMVEYAVDKVDGLNRVWDVNTCVPADFIPRLHNLDLNVFDDKEPF